MSRKQNWYIGRYVRAVSGFLPCSGKVKKPLLDALRAQAEEYIEGGGDAAALEQRFGMPQQVAAAWVDEMDTSELGGAAHPPTHRHGGGTGAGCSAGDLYRCAGVAAVHDPQGSERLE